MHTTPFATCICRTAARPSFVPACRLTQPAPFVMSGFYCTTAPTRVHRVTVQTRPKPARKPRSHGPREQAHPGGPAVQHMVHQTRFNRSNGTRYRPDCLTNRPNASRAVMSPFPAPLSSLTEAGRRWGDRGVPSTHLCREPASPRCGAARHPSEPPKSAYPESEPSGGCRTEASG